MLTKIQFLIMYPRCFCVYPRHQLYKIVRTAIFSVLKSGKRMKASCHL